MYVEPIYVINLNFPHFLISREFRRLDGNGTGRIDDGKLRQGLETIGFR